MSAFIPFRPNPSSIVWHYANGRLPMWIDGPGSPIGWIVYSHRGVQMLDQIHISRTQKQNVYNGRFDFRINTAFGEVIRACAENRGQETWITPQIIAGYEALYALGQAHSFEIWHDGVLAGGVYGVQLNGYITLESMFYRVSNAGKAAFLRALLHLRDRGFTFVDTNGAPPHVAKFGGQWVPHWRFMELHKAALRQPLSVTDDRPARPLPATFRAALPVADLYRKVRRRLGMPEQITSSEPQDAQAEACEQSSAA